MGEDQLAAMEIIWICVIIWEWTTGSCENKKITWIKQRQYSFLIHWLHIEQSRSNQNAILNKGFKSEGKTNIEKGD